MAGFANAGLANCGANAQVRSGKGSARMKPIDVYFWPTPNGFKISIALEEMGLPYQLKPVNIGAGDQFKPEFLSISPNNRMPAIIDPEGPDGKPISVFESGAILQYLGRKSGKFYPNDERKRVEVDEWLFWQMANLGPMAGQAGHFRNYAPRLVDDPKQLEYGQKRYLNELNRLYGVLDRRLADREYAAGAYSIADMAIWPWVVGFKNFGQKLEDFPVLQKWFEDAVGKRPAVVKGKAVGLELRPKPGINTDEQRKILFGQTASVVR
jgi:GSH-dependent disulfide-bond oxidoreductase